MSAQGFIIRDEGVSRFGRAMVLETLLPQLTGINLPDFVANDIDATEDLIEALGLVWDAENKG
ncbi:hypothetical protein [Thalassospira marina]|uniref:Uncharacterized protein n=1 Tax=Thalassospira marina TaxID=2048283 RepID=A0A2N3KJF2_9PROT|nr:hypothetical protein [Thalassospira marina]AUG51621.1 hypothetical protein CSC3H3_02025 [Thalassospira marina]PKR50603.1 hypothetical protein COO20_20905 [Thalassospira marina]